jgi:glycosyltransferase involved in cell wall biosynthesis
MQLSWIYYNDTVVSERGGLHSDIASVRYRLLIPMQALKALGHEINLVNVTPKTSFEALGNLPGDVLVLSKLLMPWANVFAAQSALTLRLVRTAKARGQPVIADVCDHDFEHPVFGPHFRELVQAANLIVASTPTMEAIVRQYTERPVVVIGDPYEGKRCPAQLKAPSPRGGRLATRMIRAMLGPQRRLGVLWFGHGSNLDTLAALVPELIRLTERYRLEVHVVTAAATGAVELCERLEEAYSPLCSFRFSEWSVAATQSALEDCDVVIIPSRADDMAKAVKSPNRMIESLWAGRYVAAHAIPSYEEFATYSYVGNDIVQGISAALANPRRTCRLIRAAQNYIAERYSPVAIGRQWDTVLARVVAKGAS